MPTQDELRKAMELDDDAPAPRVPGVRQVFQPPQARPRVEPQTVYVEVVPDGAIVPVDGGVILNEQFYPAMGAAFDGLDPQTWRAVGDRLFQIDGALQWIIGDWLNYGITNFETSIEEIADHFNRDPQTLQNWMIVCKSIPQSRRRDGLDFGHHTTVAALTENAQIEWLRRAHEGDESGKRWSVKQLRTAIKEAREATKEKRHKPPSISTAANKAFARLLKAKKPNAADIATMRQWLDDLERDLD